MKKIMQLFAYGVMIVVNISAITAQTINEVGNGVYTGELIEQRLDVVSGDNIVVSSATTLSGELTIKVVDEGARLTYQKRLKSNDREEARQYASEISVEIDRTPQEVTIALRAPARTSWSGTDGSGRINVILEMPANCNIETATAYFDITAIGPFASFTAAETLAAVEISKVTGPTEVKVSNRDLKISETTGMLTATNKYGTIKLEQIDTGGKSALIRNENGEILITDFTGNIDVRTSYNRVVARGLYLTGERNRFRNVSSPIYIQFDSLNTGDIMINNRYADIEIAITGLTDAVFICKTGNGGVTRAEGMKITPTLVYDNRLEFITGEGAAEARITARDGGSIIINGSAAAEADAGGR